LTGFRFNTETNNMQAPHKPRENLPFWEEDRPPERPPDILSASERSNTQNAEAERMVERIWNAVKEKLTQH
jgi:hypothetical protein